MPTQIAAAKEFIQEYFEALSGKPKTQEFIDRYVADPELKQHILEAEAAFPSYKLVPHQFVAEGDTVAVRCTFEGTHRGAPFFGVPASGKEIKANGMLFYRVADGRIAEHWMQLDTQALMSQLTS